jgi:hypothetical protein
MEASPRTNFWKFSPCYHFQVRAQKAFFGTLPSIEPPKYTTRLKEFQVFKLN